MQQQQLTRHSGTSKQQQCVIMQILIQESASDAAAADADVRLPIQTQHSKAQCRAIRRIIWSGIENSQTGLYVQIVHNLKERGEAKEGKESKESESKRTCYSLSVLPCFKLAVPL